VNSFTFNLSGAGRDGVNEYRFYDYDEGYTFNVAEFSLKKDPSERYPFGYGVVITAGLDSQKNHSYLLLLLLAPRLLRRRAA
jgi:hypothetical protein